MESEKNKINHEKRMAALINQRRHQVLIHSCIYYQFGENLVTDNTWTNWAIELEELQREYPDIAKRCIWAEAFENFDHSTGFDLPITNPYVMSTATRLLNSSKKPLDEAGQEFMRNARRFREAWKHKCIACAYYYVCGDDERTTPCERFARTTADDEVYMQYQDMVIEKLKNESLSE